MVRTQIQLTEQQARRLRAEARDQRVSLAEVIRQHIDRGLDEKQPARADLYERAMRFVGRFSGKGQSHDVAANHDQYLDDAFE